MNQASRPRGAGHLRQRGQRHGFIIRVDGSNAVIERAPSRRSGPEYRAPQRGRTQPVGFITPKLYTLKSAAKALRDITVGDNGVNSVTGYHAKAGWDPCTGLGSPHGKNLLTAL
jgi:hypothetical protein